MSEPSLRELKARAQKLRPIIHVGHAGVSDALLAALDHALTEHGLVKVRFADHKPERKRLATELASRTSSRQVLLVGHTVALFRGARQ